MVESTGSLTKTEVLPVQIKIRVTKEEGSQYLYRVRVASEEATQVLVGGLLYVSELIHGQANAEGEAKRIQVMLETLGHEIEVS